MSILKNMIAAPWNRTAPAATALALPHARAFSWSFSDRLRRRLGAGALIISIASGIAYVIAVNAILLHGEAMKREEKTLGVLEQEYAALQIELLSRQSPAWLSAQARTQGMVAVEGLRYLTTRHQSVALFR